MFLCNFIEPENIHKDFLQLAKIAYGGRLYFELKDYKLKEILLPGSKIEKTPDIILAQQGIYDFYSYKNVESGFSACVFEHTKTGKIVIAYRGTERISFGENNLDYICWGKDIMTDVNLILGNLDQQFEDAFELYTRVKEQNPNSKIVITGHSLGGGLAQLVAAKEYSLTHKTKEPVRTKTFTYNAPGCKQLLEIFGCNSKLRYSFITNYTVMNDWCGMFGENIGETYLISPIPLQEQKSNSAYDVLNNVLLTTHEGIFEYTKEFNGKIIKKPKDFNQHEGLSLWYFDKNNPIKDVDTLPEFFSAITPKINFPTIEFDKQSIKEAAEKFIEENNITIPQMDMPQIEVISEQIKDAADKFIDEQKTKLSQIEFPTPNLPEPLKKVAETISEKHAEQKEKFMESINNNVIAALTKLIETTVSQVSEDSLKKALEILQREEKIYKSKEYIEQFMSYLSASDKNA